MTWSDLVERARECGVSVPELMVLNVVRYHTPMQVHHMAGWALKVLAPLQLPYSVDDLEVAVENCLAKGWLRVVSRKEMGHQPPDYSTFIRYNKHSPGVMDFTEEGHVLAVKIFGEAQVGSA